MQATSLLFGLRGAASGLTWRLGPVSRLRFHRLVGFLLHLRCWRYLRADPSGLFVRQLQLTLTRPSGDPTHPIPAALRLSHAKIIAAEYLRKSATVNK